MRPEIKEFKKQLKSSGLKESTIKNYLWHLEKFLTWTDGKKISEKILNDYFNFLLKKYPRVNSINLRLIILNSYLKTKHKRFRFELLSTEKNNLKIISSTQLQAFLDEPTKTKKLIGLRDKALLELLYSSGLKVGEITSLKMSQIDYIKKQIIFDQKNILNINPTTWFHLEKYLDKRKNISSSVNPSPYLFINFDRSQKNSGKGLSVRSIERLIDKYAKLTNSSIVINPQVLRNTLAYSLKKEGGDYNELKKSLHFKTSLGAKAYSKRI